MRSVRPHRFVEVLAASGMAATLVLAAPACKRSKEPPPPAPASPVQETPQAASRPPPPPAAQKRIASLRAAVERDPKDVASWIALGNAYFDLDQKADAVQAYGKALELQPDNPDVLTDQGVMYRQLGASDKALVNFEKASSINPKHVQSLLNLGIVYAQDLKDFDGAIKRWERVIAVAPSSPQASRARAYIEEAKRAKQTQAK
jgi:cytochrome c-type biogenesis protein CcmH/NrfG